MPDMTARTVALLAYDGSQVLDVAGPAEVFSVANEIAGGDAYRVRIVSVDGNDAVSGTGFRVGVSGRLDDLEGPIDTLVVPGSYTWRTDLVEPALLRAVTSAAGRSTRVASVCAGAFLLGAVGLLDGRRATTHWMFLDELAARFPLANVEHDRIFVEDRPVYTSAGATTGIDLALALVESDHGAVLARDVARFLVVFMQRPGGQAQFSVHLQREVTEAFSLQGLLDTVTADPAGDHRLPTLSARAGFSERHLTRVFARELGTTPGRFVEEVRVEAARSLLETSDAPLEVIARRSGLGTAETLRRVFTREVGCTPHAYRQRFRSTGVGSLTG
jgi:transcriptional regulator GlxA family with amidase domain